MPAETRLITVGHAALDRIYRINAFPPEPTKVRALESIEIGGGMAANAAVAAARLGAKVELWSRIGDDNAGAIIRAGLKAEKVDIRALQSFEDARSSTSAIIVDGAGERLVVGMRDAAIPSGTSWLPLERLAKSAAVLADLRWLEATRSAFSRARTEGVPTILDADLGAREALPDLLKLTDYAVFSAPALRELGSVLLRPPGADPHAPPPPVTGRGGEEANDAVYLDAVLARGPKHAGVTLGAGGYLWREKGGGKGRHPGFKVDVVDTTGAGDAFHGAFALGIAEGLAMQEIVRMACAVAALKCTRLGARAGLPTRKELEAFLARAAPAA